MSVEEDKELIAFNKKFESFSDKIGFEIVPDLVSGIRRGMCAFTIPPTPISRSIGSIINFSVHTYCSHPWIGQFEDTGDLCTFRLGTGPEFAKDGHRVYVGSRPMPDGDDDDDDAWEQISLHRPRSQSLLQTATQTVARLIDYDQDTALSLSLPKTVQDEVLARIDRRNKKISPF